MTADPRLAAAPALADVTLDHVAVAVDDMAGALRWWGERGATPISGWRGPGFATEQVRLSNTGKLELIARNGDAGFIGPFLDRFGSGRIHHVTLKVACPLPQAVQHLRDAGLDVVDVRTDDPDWHEGFLRPSQVGGLIVQVAWGRLDDAGFAEVQGRGPLQPPDPAAPPLRHVVIGHPDLDHAEALWTVLGAEVSRPDDVLVARWRDAPIQLEIRRSATAGPLGLVLDGEPADATTFSPAWLATDV